MSGSYLLDTHVLLWMLSNDRALSATGRELLIDPQNTLYASAVSIWEIAIKSRLGKLEADVNAICAALAPSGIATLSFDIGDAAAIVMLPPIHRDPFDRALISHAQKRGLRLLTADPIVAKYGGDIVCL